MTWVYADAIEETCQNHGELSLKAPCITFFHGVQKITWDHKHKIDKIYGYEFESASQLIEDFWKAVEEILK